MGRVEREEEVVGRGEHVGRGGDEEMRKAGQGNERLPFIHNRSLCDGGRQSGAGMV